MKRKRAGHVLAKNALAVRHAKAIRGQRTTYRFEGERGLELRVQPSGKATWAFVYAKGPRAARVVKRVVLGHRDDTDLSKACEKAAKLRAEILDGDPVEKAKAAAIQAAKPVLTFKLLAEAWEQRHAKPNKSPAALYDDKLMLANEILPPIGAIKAESVTKSNIVQIINAVAQRGLSHRPNRVLALVRSIFRWGVSEDLIANDPTQGVKRRTKERARERVLKAEEIRKFWNGLDHAPISKGLVIAIRLALVTGQRIGEVSCIAKSELDLTPGKAVWTLPGKRSKNKETHRVPLSDLAVTLIQEALLEAGESAYLFPSPNGDKPIDPHAATRAMSRARPGLAIEDVRIHDLRRTVASHMAELGINPHTISLVLNHVSATKGTVTSAVYVKYGFDREKRAALEAWARELANMLRGDQTRSGGNVVELRA